MNITTITVMILIAIAILAIAWIKGYRTQVKLALYFIVKRIEKTMLTATGQQRFDAFLDNVYKEFPVAVFLCSKEELKAWANIELKELEKLLGPTNGLKDIAANAVKNFAEQLIVIPDKAGDMNKVDNEQIAELMNIHLENLEKSSVRYYAKASTNLAGDNRIEAGITGNL